MAGLDGDKPNEGAPDSSGSQQSGSGELDYSKIDWTKVDWTKVPVTALPDDVVKEHPVAKTLLTETVERRQKIKQLQETLADKPAEPAKPPKPNEQEAVPSWAQALITKVEAIETGTKTQVIDGAIAKAMADHKLPDKAREFLTGNTPAEVAANAAKLAAMFIPSDGTSPGNPGGGAGQESDIASRAMAIINARIAGSKPVSDKGASIFDTTIQKVK